MAAYIIAVVFIISIIVIIVKLVIFVFKSNTKTTKIKKVDENGKETIEYHETKDNTGIGFLAKIIAIVVLIIIIFFIVMVALTVANNMSLGNLSIITLFRYT